MARPVGSKNKRPSAIAIGQSLAAKSIDMADKLLKLALKAEGAGDLALAHKCYETLCRYSQVVPTAQVEPIESDIDPEIRELSTEELLQRASAPQ